MPQAIGDRKQCSTCKLVKPIGEYGVYANNPDGLKYQCKKCELKYRITPSARASQKKYKQSERAHLAYEKYKADGRKAKHDKKYLQTTKGKARMAHAQRKYRARNWQKNRARGAVNDAIRRGDLPKASSAACECNAQAACYHHHKGYEPEHWLDVIPLCQECHLKHHDRHFRKVSS